MRVWDAQSDETSAYDMMVNSETAVILSLSRKALNTLLGRKDDAAGAALGLTPEDAAFATAALKKSPALGALRPSHHKLLAGVSLRNTPPPPLFRTTRMRTYAPLRMNAKERAQTFVNAAFVCCGSSHVLSWQARPEIIRTFLKQIMPQLKGAGAVKHIFNRELHWLVNFQGTEGRSWLCTCQLQQPAIQ